MAIIILGSTECALCGKVLVEGENIKALPATVDTQHSLYEYFDGGFHAHCFDNWNKKAEVLRVIKKNERRYIESNDFKEMFAKYGKPEWLDEVNGIE